MTEVTDAKLTLLLIKKEIAKRNVRASLATLFLLLLSVYFAFAIPAYKVIILVCSVITVLSLGVRVYYSNKFLEDSENENYWFITKLTHWLNAILLAVILTITVFNIEPTSPHYFVLFAFLGGFIANSIFTLALDATLFFPTLAMVFASLIGVSIHSLNRDIAHSNYIFVTYAVFIIYTLLQYVFLKRQLLDNIAFQLQLKRTNKALQKKDSQQEHFVNLILTLLSNKEPLDKIYKTLIGFFEDLNPDTTCSILFLDKDKKRFEKVYAPKLPSFYNEAIPHLDIGANAGSCGTAAYLGKRIIVEDIQNDPLWANYRDLAKAANLASCWSQPIKSLTGEVLGTFAIYHAVQHSPSARDIQTIEHAANLVSIILRHFETARMVKLAQERIAVNEADLVYAQHVAQMGSWKWDAKTDTVHWSREIYDILGLDPTTAPLPFVEQSKLYTEESWKRLSIAVAEALATGGSYEVDLQGLANGNDPRWFVARGAVIEQDSEGRPIRLAGTLQNITERKLLENNLKSALNARDEFIAVATHELKTPLTTLQLSLYVIAKSLDGVIDKEKLLAQIEKTKLQGDRLESLIKNLLDVTSIGAGHMRLELKPNVNISNLVENVSKKFEDEITKLGCVLIKKIEPDITGLWDEFRLEQIITNLISNAIKYGDKKPIEIHLRRNNQNVLLEVHDQGIGIAEDKQKKIFERFERAVSETSYKGLGLGLWIVKEIVTALKGKVWVTSTLNKGSVFSVELPIQ